VADRVAEEWGRAGVEMATGTYPLGTGMEAFFYPYTGTGNPTGKTYFFFITSKNNRQNTELNLPNY